MTVKEIIIKSATLIGREDIVNYLTDEQNSVPEQTIKAVDVMIRLLNLVINELACSFIPMVCCENLSSQNKKILYTQLTHSPLEILNAYDDNGNDVLITATYSFAKVGADNVELRYSYFPQSVGLEDSVGYTERDVPSRVLAYGLCAEFAVSQGCFKDAVCWHERYADSIAELCAPKNVKIKRRKWL